MVDALISTIQKNKEYLSEIDGAIGDGDHGVNMNKGFTMCAEALKDRQYNLSEGLAALSEILIDDIGGSMGPLYGMFFEALADESRDKEEITGDVFGKMLRQGLSRMEEIGNARCGDKCMLDTIVPAVEAFEQAQAQGKSFRDSLTQMKAAAKTGWESTKNMVAKVGRASRLGERSRGYLDAGATSSYLMLSSICDSIGGLL